MKFYLITFFILFNIATIFAQTNNFPDSNLLQKGVPLPLFNVLNLDSSISNTAQIPNDKNVVLVLFNPTCGHCQTVGKNIKDSIKKFTNTHFIFVAGLPTFTFFKEFTEFTNLKSAENISIGGDYSNITPSIFAFNGIPQIMIYDENKKLKEIIYKEISIAQLYNSINNISVPLKKSKRKKKMFSFSTKK
jgi:thioredoxin-related protein